MDKLSIGEQFDRNGRRWRVSARTDTFIIGTAIDAVLNDHYYMWSYVPPTRLGGTLLRARNRYDTVSAGWSVRGDTRTSANSSARNGRGPYRRDPRRYDYY